MYTCRHCKTVVGDDKRGHLCKSTRSIRGQMVDSNVLYNPSFPKSNKQSTVPGYMKRFGSRPAKS